MILPNTSAAPTYEPPAPPRELLAEAPRYASVAERVGASAIDCAITIGLSIPLFLAEGRSRAEAILWMAALWLVWLLYSYVAYSRWGKTVGKWALRIRLVSADGSSVSIRQILARCSVFFAFGLLVLPGYWIALGRFHAEDHGPMPMLERQALIEELTPVWGDLLGSTYWLFMAASVIALLVSPRKQALHDMYAGTVVLSERTPIAAAPRVARQHRALALLDWTLATVLALGAIFFVLAAVGAKLDTNPATAAELNAAVKPMLFFAAAAAVLAVLMARAALSLRTDSTYRRVPAHLIAYLLTFAPVALLVFGYFLGAG